MEDECSSLQNALDAEFREILCIIKPYILKINNPYHLEKYRVWLERLSEAALDEKFERNKYLVELANQIQDGVLRAPFLNEPPPLGALVSLRRFLQPKCRDQGWPYYHQRRSRSRQFEPVRQPLPMPVRSKFFLSHPPHQRRRNTSRIKLMRHRMIHQLEVGTDETESEDGNGSWFDLSVASCHSTRTLACGDTDVENNGQDELMHDMNDSSDVKKMSIALKHEEAGMKLKEHFLKQYEAVNKNIQVDVLETTDQELEALKLRMEDLIQVKNALVDTHCLTEDRKKTIATLQSKLDMAEKKNAELKKILERQMAKMHELEQSKNQEMKLFKDKLGTLRAKELDVVRSNCSKQIESLEKVHQVKIDEIQAEYIRQAEEFRKNQERKMLELKVLHETTVKEKNDEITQLRNELKLKSESPPPEDNSEHIIHLKKCISKLDKLLHKNEKDYLRKVEKLRQELELKDMSTQVQLHTQKADLMVRNSAAKQEELKGALNSLEIKYKSLMETLQMQALTVKRRDDEIITELKSLLDRHHIPYLSVIL